MATFKAVIFDFDGTLVDSELLHFQSWNEAIKPFGISLTKDDYFSNFVGVPALGNAELILARHALPALPQELVASKEAALHALADTVDTPFMPFAEQLLKQLYAQKIPMSIVSGSHKSDILRVVQRTNIGHYFQHIISCDDVAANKPDPEGYLACAKKMGFNKHEYLVVEDTSTGTQAAKSAGLTCYAVQHEEKYHKGLKDAGADQVFLNLDKAFEAVLV
jgi:HAD superfamily hydrolase (TIGR01509 family)